MTSRGNQEEDGGAPSSSALKKPYKVPELMPYKAPELIPWGTLRDVTQKIGVSHMNDGGLLSGLMKTGL